MNKLKSFMGSNNLITVGVALAVLSNPLLYLVLGGLMIDLRNIFGASLNRQSVSFNTNDPFIQAMSLVSAVGVVLIVIGHWKHRNFK